MTHPSSSADPFAALAQFDRTVLDQLRRGSGWLEIAQQVAAICQLPLVEICRWHDDHFKVLGQGGAALRVASSQTLTSLRDLEHVVLTQTPVYRLRLGVQGPLPGVQLDGPVGYVGVVLYEGSTPVGVLSGFPIAPIAATLESQVWKLDAIAQRLSRLLTYTIHTPVPTPPLHPVAAVSPASRDAEARYALAVQGFNDGIWDWDVQTGELYLSSRWQQMLGYEDSDLPSTLESWFGRVHADDLASLEAAIAHHQDHQTDYFEAEYRLRHRNGDYRWMIGRGVAIRNEAGAVLRLTGSQTDITDRKQAEEQLRHHALHDQLTGLANRILFRDRLAHIMTLTRRYEDRGFGVMFLDLDRFKRINDSLGHWAGDQLLVEVGYRLLGCLRGSDTCARLGGDEFVILLEQVGDRETVIQIAERIQAALKQPIVLNDKEVVIDTSIGIVLGHAGYTNPDDLLRDADTAMYHAKASGKGRYEVFTPEMHESALAMLTLETDLRQAFQNQEFQLYYQPIVSLRGKQLVGFEALLRWQHSTRGLVRPEHFMSVAEESGLIVPMGWWVLRHACQSLKAWQLRYIADPPLSVSVNISKRQFFQPDFVAQVIQTLTDVGLDPNHLKLEITESTIMEDINTALRHMDELKAYGVQLCMDDFGTGYSSLGHLHRFPIEVLKLDPSFLQAADTDLEKLEVIRTLTNLAWNLGISVVAEGVENTRQLAQLNLMKCDFAQGHLFSEPMPSKAVPSFLTRSLLQLTLK